MSRSILLIYVLLICVCCGCPAAPRATRPAPSTTTADDISKHPVIGALGLPLGTVIEIQATVMRGSELLNKRFDGIYMLRVTRVADHPLAEPGPMQFSIPSIARVNLASDPFALYELKTGNKTGKLDGPEIAELEKEYVGKDMKLLVYETGGYSGMPDSLPEVFKLRAHYGFSFFTSLVVLEERH